MENLQTPGRWPWWAQLTGLLLAAFLAILVIRDTRDLLLSVTGKKPDNTISVSAEGKVKAVPDTASVQLGVVAREATAEKAQTNSSDRLNKITEFAKGLGIAKEDITTSQSSTYPTYNYKPDGTNEITGYESRQTVTVVVRKVNESTESLSKLVAGAVKADMANEIYGTNFYIDDPDQFRQEARLAAIEKAKQKGKELADAAGLRLGKIVSINESGFATPTPYPMYGEGIGGGAMPVSKDSSAPNYEPGTQEIIQSMTIIFEVK